MMLRHLGEYAIADKIQASVLRICEEGLCLTGDLGGKASTDEYTAEVIRLAS